MRSLVGVSPVLALTVGSFFVLVAGLWIRSKTFQFWTCALSLGAAFGLELALRHEASQDLFSGLVMHDPLAVFFGAFAMLTTGLVLVMSFNSLEIKADRNAEYCAILLALATGLCFMASANHLLMIYLAIETVSILSYTLAGFNREHGASVEASLKYVVYGSMASAIMIFGFSLLFGITGAPTLTGMRAYFAATPASELPPLLWVAVLMSFAGLGYKVSVAPMHMWTPDVYEGAPTPVSAFLSVAPKAAGLALLIRFFVVGFGQNLLGSGLAITNTSDAAALGYQITSTFDWPRFLLIASIFTMFLGNLAALGQTSVKRILAYSSIAHAGYLLMGLTTQTSAGLAGLIFYAFIYCLMNVGAFWVTSQVTDTLGNDDLRHFRGLIYRRPLSAVCMAIFLFSLGGLPPFAGFVGKFYLFNAVLGREMYGLALIAGLNSVISLYYYAKIAKAMILESPEFPFPQGKTPFEFRSSQAFIVLLAVSNVVLGLYWEPLMRVVRETLSVFAG